MTQSTRDLLVQVLEKVLEQFAFAFCELVKKDELETEETEFVQSSLSFTGPKSGELSITMPAELCAEIAGNVLGLNPGEGDIVEYAQDSLRELLNVFAGNVLTTLYGEDALFDFGTPSIVRLDETEWQALIDDPSSIGITIEDSPALLCFSVQPE